VYSVGVLVQTRYEPWPDKRKSGDEVINEKTMRYSDGYSDVSLRKLSGLNATYFTPFCIVFFV